MNSSTANPPVFRELNLPHPIQSPYVAQQAYKSYGNHLALDDSASRMQTPDRQFTADQSHMSHPFNPSRAFRIHAPHNAEYFGKARILELHITQKLPLREVKEKIEKEMRQYRTRISQWGKDKNIKPVEMTAIVRKRQQRKLVTGSTVESQMIDRWMNRHRVPEYLLYAPSPAASPARRTV
ncbi:hypothetical protein EDB81DRAFT_846911 [Dactylonectria macrodidyma]|uniref:Clr5 domain-containing protein n=1 Tax=Dactylonectria macrodidyma TaxID=307937 RepID=A0A9P9DT83_9HYPO|nr:hypothetical protein EDB81DRAFT_846911 [Dactylonectria macrodidyma]